VTVFASLVISGLVGGGLAAMIAIGLVMTYKTTGIFNLAQGSIAFLAAFIFLELEQAARIPGVVSALITVLVIAPILGLLLEVWLFRRLSKAPEMARIVAPVGLALAIPAFVSLALQYLGDVPHLGNRIVPVVGANPIPLGPNPSHSWNLGLQVVIDSNQVIALGITVVSTVGYWYLLRRTRLGLDMRAVVDGHELASLRGVSHARVSRLAWVLSFSSAALVGVCGSISLGLNPDTYLELVFVAAAAAVLGGLSSVPIAFAGALLLGVVQNLATTYLQRGPLSGVSGIGSAVPFIAMLAGLYVVGRRRARVAGLGSSASDAPVELTRERRTLRQRVVTIALIVLSAVLILTVVGPYWNEFVAEGLGLSIIYLSLVVVTGLAGVVSLAQAAFVTCGGLLTGWLATTYGLPLWTAALLAVLAAMVAGLVVAIPAVRLGGLQLALATLALAYVFSQLVFQIPAVAGGGGIGNSGDLTGWTILRPNFALSNSSYSILLLAVLLVLVWLVRNFQLSAIGRSVLAVRGSRPGAVAAGVSLARPIAIAFAFSAMIAAVGGFFTAQTLGTISNTSYPPLTALLWVTVAISIGIRRPTGAILAGMTTAIGAQLLTYVTTSTEWPNFLFGIGAVVLAEYPGGTLDLQVRQFIWIRDHILPKRCVEWARAYLSHSSSPIQQALEFDTALTEHAAMSGKGQDSIAPSGVENGHSDVSSVLPCGSRVDGSTALGLVTSAGLGPGEPAIQREVTLAISGLRAGYGALEVLHDLDLTVERGKITALFGANGAGKSTLCSVLAGLLRASVGEIELDGEPIMKLSSLQRLKKGIFVVTESRAIFPKLTVEENLRVALRTTDLVEQAMAESKELRERRRTHAGMLSGGEQQMLAMAPALVMQPRVLIADEPHLGLAPKAKERVLGVCRHLRDRGSAVLLIEERPADVFELADEIALLRLGHVEWQRAKQSVSADELIESYLAVRD
jgi:ABC-type branched-subunit amino acid transport system ATPase component/branched-subunit amino acid ABC-type transport system permease component